MTDAIMTRQTRPCMWPWIRAADESKRGWQLIDRAERVWADFRARENDVAEYMVMHHADFWPACLAVFENGNGRHVCPRCGHEWCDQTKEQQ